MFKLIFSTHHSKKLYLSSLSWFIWKALPLTPRLTHKLILLFSLPTQFWNFLSPLNNFRVSPPLISTKSSSTTISSHYILTLSFESVLPSTLPLNNYFLILFLNLTPTIHYFSSSLKYIFHPPTPCLSFAWFPFYCWVLLFCVIMSVFYVNFL